MKSIKQKVEIKVISTENGIGMNGIVRMIEDIETDGSAMANQIAVNRIVNREFPVGTVLHTSWLSIPIS